ncbi:Zinc finger, CCHC-type [Sesbania bispinosa]|nr:Zinc finger, CCHC-type [Sesbania bispinosa]
MPPRTRIPARREASEEMRVKRFIRGLREYIFRSVVGSNCSTFAEVLSLALQLEQRKKEKENSGRDSRKKQRVEGSQSSHPSVGVGSVPGYQVQQRAVSQRGGSSWQSFGTAQSRRSDQGRFSRTTFPQRHFGVTSTPCPTCGRHHTEVRMPPRTRIPARREASGVANVEVPRARRGNPGMVEITTGLQGLQQVDQQPGATTGGIEVTLAEFMKLKPPTFSGSNANEDPQRFIDGLERLWRVLGCSDIRAVELASFQLEGVAYDWFDTVTRGRSVGSPPLAWGEFSRLLMARFLPESVRDGHAPYPITEEMRVKRFIRGLREYIFRSVVGSNCSTFAEVLSLALQLEQRKKEKWNSGRDSRKKQRVEGLQSSHPSVGVGSVPDYQVQQRAVSQRGGSSWQSFGTAQSRRSDQGRFSRTTFPQRHFGVTSTPCPTCGRHHTGVCFGDNRVCYQCGQAGHIRTDCPVAMTQPSSSHASASAAIASSQAPSAPVRQFGGSSGRGSGVAQ